MKINVQAELCKAAYALGSFHAKVGKAPAFPTIEIELDKVLYNDFSAPENELESYRNGYGTYINKCFNQALKGSGDPDDVFYPHKDGRSFETKKELREAWFNDARALDLAHIRAIRTSVPDRRLAYYNGHSPIAIEEVELWSSADAPPEGSIPTDYEWED